MKKTIFTIFLIAITSVTFGQVGTMKVVTKEQQTDSEQIKIYPNPNCGLFEVQTVQVADEISVYDVIGREICRVVPVSINTTMNLLNQPYGIYFVEVCIGNNIETKRFGITSINKNTNEKNKTNSNILINIFIFNILYQF